MIQQRKLEVNGEDEGLKIVDLKQPGEQSTESLGCILDHLWFKILFKQGCSEIWDLGSGIDTTSDIDIFHFFQKISKYKSNDTGTC